MKYLFILSWSLFLIIGVAFYISTTDNQALKYENKKLKEMNNIIINYANSTADTGEFDEFVQSKAGQYYFELNKELYGKE